MNNLSTALPLFLIILHDLALVSGSHSSKSSVPWSAFASLLLTYNRNPFFFLQLREKLQVRGGSILIYLLSISQNDPFFVCLLFNETLFH